jgi:hypothetical protein
MRKFVIAVAVAAVLWTPEAASRQTILQKTDWRTKPFETYLPPPISVPGLDLDIRTKPPKLDAPFGWQANALPPYQLHRSPTDARVSSTAVLDPGEDVAMSEPRWIKLDELRRPGMRLVIDARRQIEEEAPRPIDEPRTASVELAKRQDDSPLPQ